MKEKTSALTARDIAECAIFVALMIASAYLTIPLYPIPLTLQTAVCILCGLLLGAKKGAAAMLAYALIGVLGLPVFSGAKGGISSVLTPTFGYVIGFVFAALLAGILREKNNKASYKRAFFASVLACALCYLSGIIYFVPIWINVYGGADTLIAAIFTYNVIYLPKDLLLCLLTSFVCVKVLPRKQ